MHGKHSRCFGQITKKRALPILAALPVLSRLKPGPG
jgi:hypothetical protein